MTDYFSQFFSQYQPQNKKKRAFISFDVDKDEQLKNLLSGQAKNSDSPFYFEDWSVKKPFPQSTWKLNVRAKIKQCDFVIVLIGLNTYNSSGVLEEIIIANEENIPMFGIYEKGRVYYVPTGLGKRFIEWNWNYIANVIDNLSSYLPQKYG